MQDRRLRLRLWCTAALAAAVWLPATAQDRLKSMPGYEQYQKMAREIPGSVTLGALAVRWKDDSSSFEYAWNGTRYVFDMTAKKAAEAGAASAPIGGGRGGRGGVGGPARG